MRRFPLGRLFPILLIVLLAVQGMMLVRRHERERTPSVTAAIGSEPLFRLQGADGRDVTEADLRGRWALVCLAPSGDEEALRHLAGSLRALGGQAGTVAAVFVATDTPPLPPERAAAVAHRFGPGITGLSGSRDALAVVERAFGVRPGVRGLVPGEAPLPGSGPVIAVLGPDGRLRDTLPGSSNSETIAARLRTLGLGR